MELSDVVVVSAVRTPMGRFGGTLHKVASYDLGATAIRAASARIGLDPAGVDEVIYGSCRQAGNGPNPARTAGVRGGLDISVPVQTINMACPSGMITVIHATRALRTGDMTAVMTGIIGTRRSNHNDIASATTVAAISAAVAYIRSNRT